MCTRILNRLALEHLRRMQVQGCRRVGCSAGLPAKLQCEVGNIWAQSLPFGRTATISLVAFRQRLMTEATRIALSLATPCVAFHRAFCRPFQFDLPGEHVLPKHARGAVNTAGENVTVEA